MVELKKPDIDLLDYSQLDWITNHGIIVPGKAVQLGPGSGFVMDVKPKDMEYFNWVAGQWYATRMGSLVEWKWDENSQPPEIIELGAGWMNRTIKSLLLSNNDWTADQVTARVHALDIQKPEGFDEYMKPVLEKYPNLQLDYKETDLKLVEPITTLAALIKDHDIDGIYKILTKLREKGLAEINPVWPEIKIPELVGFEGVGDYLSKEVNGAIFILIGLVWQPNNATIRWVFNGQIEREAMTTEQLQRYEASIREAEVIQYAPVQKQDLSRETISRFLEVTDTMFTPENLTREYKETHNLSPDYAGTYPMVDKLVEAMMSVGYKPFVEFTAYEREPSPNNKGHFKSNVGSVVLTFTKNY